MERFRRCSTCRRDIHYGDAYFVCSVSTCNRARIGLTFCSMPCWDAHLPEARHREAWAEERRATPEADEPAAASPAPAPAPRRVVVAPPAAAAAAAAPSDEIPR